VKLPRDLSGCIRLEATSFCKHKSERRIERRSGACSAADRDAERDFFAIATYKNVIKEDVLKGI
jgi:hypothetical protein